MNKTWIYVILAVLCAANLWLSFYIAEQKAYNDTVSADECFLGDGGCYTVQTSSYATTFGIKNPHYGMLFFTLGILVFCGLALNEVKEFIPLEIHPHIVDISGFGLILGALFSVWLLFVQFSILQTTCKYCLWLDGIMIAMAVIFWVFKKK